MSDSSDNQSKPPEKLPWYHQREFIFANLFFILGPLALPLLIKSKAFSRGEKWFFSIFVTLLTVVALALGAVIILIFYKHYQVLNSVMDEAF